MSGKWRVERVEWSGVEQGRAGQAEHQHSQAVQLHVFSMTILHDLRVTVCVCSEGSALFHISSLGCVKSSNESAQLTF